VILEAKDISFQYESGNRWILSHVDMRVESHERVGLIAPSGFGKTTLCKILAGYERPAAGQVLLDGKPLSYYGAYCPVQMVWQHPEQVVNPRLRMGAVLAEGDSVEPEILEALGIEKDWLGRFPGELSGGELQRFCIARALGRRTKFLLADEISTMLDLITQSQLWRFLLEECTRRQIGLLAVSHSPALLARVCTRQIHLETL
jgi:peptide/nickel transport system ATP-binding protein